MMRKFLITVVALAATFGSSAFQVERVMRPEIFGRGDANVRPQQPIDDASWLWLKGRDRWGGAVFSETRTDRMTLAREPQCFLKFRKEFTATDEPLVFDVSADERFVLLLDGKEIARGPNRGLRNRWHYESYRITDLALGVHRLDAIVWQVGEHAPLAQVSVRGGFVFKAEGGYDALLTTGKTAWQVGELVNTRMTWKGVSGAFGVGSQCEVRGCSLLDEEPKAWEKAVVVRGPVKYFAGLLTQGWMLFPSTLRDQMYEEKTPGFIARSEGAVSAISSREPFTVPAHSVATVWWSLENYYCAYPLLTVSGGAGAEIHWDWAECLTDAKGEKGDRAAYDGLDMAKPFGDVFYPDGRADARFTTPWWRAGRWCRLTITTDDQPLTVSRLSIAETRYPVELRASFICDDETVMKMQPICARSLQMCMHEMFLDCPYYEQQMYPGDSRLQYLVAGLFDPDDLLVRNAIGLFDADRRENGMIPMNCPTRGTQDALGFTCCEAMMFGDYAMNQTNRIWLVSMLAGLNHTLMGLAQYENAEGLLGKTPGWNFVDWVPTWLTPQEEGGVPPDGNAERPNAEINLQYLHAIRSAVIAEEAVGEMELAEYWRRKANRLASSIKRAFWCPEKALFASRIAKDRFSEHAQCLALLADVVTGDEAKACFKSLVETPNLDRATIYYQHYLFAAYFKFGRGDLFLKNLGFWKDCLDWHCSTILEKPWTNSRSDCHGWGSHPLWHLHTGTAGVRSIAPFYSKVAVAPQPGQLSFIKSKTPTPKGDVVLDLRFSEDSVEGTVALPDDLPGVFVWRDETIPLTSGTTTHVSAGIMVRVEKTNHNGR